MSKSIRSYPEWERKDVIARRIKNNAGGLGTLAITSLRSHSG